MDKTEKRKKLERLRADLDACGGRGVELAEEIDQLACELGDCVYDAEACGWKSPSSHSLSDLHGGTWGEHPDYGVCEWAYEVDADDTRLGYWAWVKNQIDMKEHDDD